MRFNEGIHTIKLCVYDEYFAQSCDEVLVDILPNPESFIRGDSNKDGAIDVSDAIYLLSFLFLGGEEVPQEPVLCK